MSKKNKVHLVCANCGSNKKPKFKRGGSSFIEVLLYFLGVIVWLETMRYLGFIPAVIYTGWRNTKVKKRCADCHSSNLIPEGTPRGEQLKKEFKNDKS